MHVLFLNFRKLSFVRMLSVFLIFVIPGLKLSAQSANDRPRLVIGIMVDGLQQHHLQQLWTRFNGDGFKRLVASGVSFRSMSTNTTSFGNASDITTLYTGTVPHYHGITGDRVLNISTQELNSVFQDKSQSGIQSHLQLSARAMEATTWVDELMMAGRSRSKSFVVAINAEDAIAMGGHSATGVVWLDDVHLRWGSTDYYSGGMPWQAAQMNTAGVVKEMANRNWQALFFPRTYLAAVSDPNVKDFSYKPADRQTGTATGTILKTTPMANSLVSELGIKLINEQELGKDMHTDALLLQFTVRTPGAENSLLTSIEKEDMYLRLDNALQELILTAEKSVGAEHVMFLLFGSQNDTHSPVELRKFNFHAGFYNSYRSMALLNSYLMALYGQEKWVKAYYGRHIYLNRELIEEKGHDFKKFQQVVADFVAEFEGVQNAWPLHQLLQLPVNPDTEMARLRNAVHRKTAGDVVIMLKPGWLETDDQNRPVGVSGSLITRFPVYLSGWKLAPQVIRTAQYQTDIAPTITGLLQLPTPNAAIGTQIDIQLNEK